MTEEDLLIARLSEETILVQTGTDSPKRLRFTFSDGYEKAGDDAPSSMQDLYKKQYAQLNSFLKSKGKKFDHVVVWGDGRQFIAFSGSPDAPELIWRRSGVGMGSSNVVYYRGNKLSTATFLGYHDQDAEFVIGSTVKVAVKYLKVHMARTLMQAKYDQVKADLNEFNAAAYYQSSADEKNSNASRMQKMIDANEVEFKVRCISGHKSEQKRKFALYSNKYDLFLRDVPFEYLSRV